MEVQYGNMKVELEEAKKLDSIQKEREVYATSFSTGGFCTMICC